VAAAVDEERRSARSSVGVDIFGHPIDEWRRRYSMNRSTFSPRSAACASADRPQIVDAPVGRSWPEKPLARRPPRRCAHAALDEISQLARSDASIPATDPLGDQAAVLLGRLLPCEMTGVETMNRAVREEVVEVLVVRLWHQVILAAGQDLGRRGDRREQVTQHWVLLGVMPNEPGRLREASEGRRR